MKIIYYILLMTLTTLSIFSKNTRAAKICDDTIINICMDLGYKKCKLLSAIVHVESTGKIRAFNSEQTGSYGLGQVQCKTAKFLKMKGSCNQLFDPKTNIKYIIKYLQYLEKRYTKETDVIAAYNLGHVKRKNICNIPYRCDGQYVNQKYVAKVMKYLYNKKIEYLLGAIL